MQSLTHWGPGALAPGQQKTPAASLSSLCLHVKVKQRSALSVHAPYAPHPPHPPPGPNTLPAGPATHDKPRQAQSVCGAIIHHCINKHELVMAQLDGLVLTFTSTIMGFSSF